MLVNVRIKGYAKLLPTASANLFTKVVLVDHQALILFLLTHTYSAALKMSMPKVEKTTSKADQTSMVAKPEEVTLVGEQAVLEWLILRSGIKPN